MLRIDVKGAIIHKNVFNEVILLKRLLKYFRGYGKQCVLGPLFKLLEATFELFIPLVVANIVDKGIGSGDKGYIIQMCLVMIGLGIIGLVCAVTAQYFAASAAVGFAARLRHALMKHVLGLSYTQIDTLGTSTMITRMTSDVNQVQNGVNLTLRLLLRSPFVVFGAMIMAFTIDAKAALVFAGVIPALCVIGFGIMLITMPMYRGVQSRVDSVTSATRQNLTGVRVLRAFCKEKTEIKTFESETAALTRQQLLAGRISGLMNPVTYAVINVAVILLIRVGAVKVDNGILTQGQVVALYNYMSQILVELIKMANLIITITKAVACANRVSQVLDLQSSQQDGEEAWQSPRGSVEFQNVSARYAGAGEPSLEDISFLAEAGQTVGIIGGTGSGKTTLVNLISRFYDAQQGVVLLDGRPVGTLRRGDLRQKIGIVPQKAVLFRGSIRENLRWRRDEASDTELLSAAETAQAKEVIAGKSAGLDAPVEQNGKNFSGGQRQRLTIARALVGEPDILLLDDSSSALDYATDAALRTSIASLPYEHTPFIVSQRTSSIMHADKIIVLDDAEMVGLGTHRELYETCETYREIHDLQFSGKKGKAQ